MTRPLRPRGAPSWLGTLVVVLAVLVLLLRAASQLRGAVAPEAPSPSGAASIPPAR